MYTTYEKLRAAGDTTTILAPPKVGEALGEFARRTHGHVLQRADGVLAKCGGPALCKVCQVEQQIVDILTDK